MSSNISLKSVERKTRMKGKQVKLYDVQGNLPTSPFNNFICSTENKLSLLRYLAESWTDDMVSAGIPVKFFIAGGFDGATRTVMVSEGHTEDVTLLQCNHEDADTRMVVHALYSIHILNAERIVLHCNDTDVIVLCIYYCWRNNITDIRVWMDTSDNDMLSPVLMSQNAWPENMEHIISCKCKKDCLRNCSCTKHNVRRHCQGRPGSFIFPR